MNEQPEKIDQTSLEGETLETTEVKEPAASEIIEPNGSTGDSPALKDNAPKKPTLDNQGTKLSPIKKLAMSRNLYFVIFVILFLAACTVIFAAVKINGRNNSKLDKTGTSLSNDDLAKLSSATTIVGDSKQTLDIQSAAIFEGQVLVRGELNVAGALKVGGALSIPSLATGSGNFGQLQVNDNFTSSGNATVQGQLSVQKNLSVAGSGSFGSLSAAQLSVTSLQFNGDLAINRHITPGGGVPGKSNGSALGGGGTASVSGSDTAGTVTANTGSSPPSGCFITINFAQQFNTTPHVVISPSNSSASSLNYYVNRSNTSFSVCTTSAPAAATTYVFDYVALD